MVVGLLQCGRPRFTERVVGAIFTVESVEL